MSVFTFVEGEVERHPEVAAGVLVVVGGIGLFLMTRHPKSALSGLTPAQQLQALRIEGANAANLARAQQSGAVASANASASAARAAAGAQVGVARAGMQASDYQARMGVVADKLYAGMQELLARMGFSTQQKLAAMYYSGEPAIINAQGTYQTDLAHIYANEQLGLTQMYGQIAHDSGILPPGFSAQPVNYGDTTGGILGGLGSLFNSGGGLFSVLGSLF